MGWLLAALCQWERSVPLFLGEDHSRFLTSLEKTHPCCPSCPASDLSVSATRHALDCAHGLCPQPRAGERDARAEK